MSTQVAAPLRPQPAHRLTAAWLGLCAAVALHVTDETLTGFLAVYNPTVIALRQRLGWWPMPTFGFRTWLTGLIVAVLIGLALTPLARRNAPGWRLLAYFLAIMMTMNGVGHTLGTIFGRTLPAVQFPRPMPGFWSSPVLIIASLFLLYELRQTKTTRIGRSGDPVIG